MNKKCIIILEYGVPHYRRFVFEWFKKKFDDIKIIHSGERFGDQYGCNTQKGINLRLVDGISLCIFNIFTIKNYDIVISTLNIRKPHTWMPWFFFGNKSWIFWGQGIGKSNFKIIKKIKKYIINNSIGYVAYTQEGKDGLIHNGVLSNKVTVAYNTLKINNSIFTEGSEYLLYVGRIQKRKGLLKVLHAIKGTEIKFVIVGSESDYGKELQEEVSRMNLNKQVAYKGEIMSENKLKQIFSKAVAYISPDHVGLGVVHAFAYGVPVITCKNKEHAPEYYYCNDANSYLYEKDCELPKIIESVYEDKQKHKEKKKNAYKVYKNKLKYDNVYNAFEYHFDKIE